MKSKFISAAYTKNPKDVRFEPKHVEMNSYHTPLQYESTKMSIKSQGQTKPIYMLNGLCVDGRHRTKIAVELGREVLCVDLNPELTAGEIALLSNEEVLTGRDYNVPQRAIWALRNLVLDLGMSATEAAKASKVNRRLISYASTISGLGRDDLLDIIMNGDRVQLNDMNRASMSLEVICKYVKAEKEEQSVVVNDDERVYFNPDASIKTEKGKAWFYDKMELLGIDNNAVVMRMDYSELANLKFKDSKDEV